MALPKSVLPASKSKQRYSAWEIAGIQHELFLRVLPGLRHELVGPISVSRMGISVLKRTLEKGEADQAALQQQVLRMDEQLQQSVLGVRALRLWDEDSNMTASAADIISHGIKLMSYRLSLRNITIDYPLDDAPLDDHSLDDSDDSKLIYQPFLYTWLGLLGYFEDHFTYPVLLSISQLSSNALRVRYQRSSVEVAPLHADLQETKRHPIDQHALLGLAQHYDISIAFGEDELTFHWQ